MNLIISFIYKKWLFAIALLVICISSIIFLTYEKIPHAQRVILITIDTLRADHLGAYGYRIETSPFFDSLAKNGILFKNAFTSMSATCPAHASIFTSLYPMTHGVLNNHNKLDNSFITMAEIFKKAGYKTAGIVSTRIHFKSHNIDQGFDFFDEPYFDKSSGDVWPYRSATNTINVAIKWIDNTKNDEKFFLWIHLYDPHQPLRPPEAMIQKIKNLQKGDFTQYLTETQQIGLKYYTYDKQKLLDTITKYDAEILYADSEIKRFFEYYNTKKSSLLTLWILTADHGEGLGSHDYYRHEKNLYNEQLKTPLLFFYQSSIKGKTVDEMVENVDIFPTIFDLLQDRPIIPPNIQGKSLVPLIFSRYIKPLTPKYAFSQRMVFNDLSATRSSKIGYPEKGEKFALQSLTYKYIYRTEGGDAFFNLIEDPYEVHNLIDKDSPEKPEFKKNLLQKIKQLEKTKSGPSLEVDTVVKEQLKSLGYIE